MPVSDKSAKTCQCPRCGRIHLDLQAGRPPFVENDGSDICQCPACGRMHKRPHARMFRLEILKGRQRRYLAPDDNGHTAWWGVVCQNELSEVVRIALITTSYNERRWLRLGRVDETGSNFTEIFRWRCSPNVSIRNKLNAILASNGLDR